MKILVFADNMEISQQFESIISEKYPGCYIESVSDPQKADTDDYYDIVFVDDKIGKDPVSSTIFIQNRFPESKTVFVSDSLETVSELLLNTKVFGVIEKPLNPPKVYKYIKYVRDCKENASEIFSFTERGRKRNVSFSSIVYIESNREKLLVNTVKSRFGIWKKMSDVESQFPDYFVRCHNSFLVNMKYISDYKSGIFIMVDGSEIVISRSKKEEAIKKFCEYKDSIR